MIESNNNISKKRTNDEIYSESIDTAIQNTNISSKFFTITK